MNVNEVRLSNLHYLLKRCDNNKAALARKLKKAPAQVTQWFAGLRKIGEHSARDIEEAFDLPYGFLDYPHGLPGEQPPVASHVKKDIVLADVLRFAPDAERKKVLNDIRLTMLKARSNYSPEELEKYLDALDEMEPGSDE